MIVLTMFLGHTAVECLDDDAAIMLLMSDPDGNRERMRNFMKNLSSDMAPADLDCIPDNATSLTSTGILQATDLRSVDCKPWHPEPPESIGFYPTWIWKPPFLPQYLGHDIAHRLSCLEPGPGPGLGVRITDRFRRPGQLAGPGLGVRDTSRCRRSEQLAAGELLGNWSHGGSRLRLNLNDSGPVSKH